MKFEKVIGQHQIKQKLIQAYRDNRVSHSYLFYGSPGVGKLALAIAFAQYISCTNKLENDSCGECPSCKKFEKLIHPDLHFVFPVISNPKKKSISDNYIQEWRAKVLEDPYFTYNEWLFSIASENKQGSIFADESVEIAKKINLKTFESDYKCMIIWLPEMMNGTCANKLLKILEEPPQNTIIISVSDNSEDILPTIRSRTQPVKILGIEDNDLKDAIIRQYNISDQMASDIVNISNGSLFEARKQIITNDETEYNFAKFTELMRVCYGYKIPDAINLSEELAKNSREKQKNFLYYSLVLLRENFAYNSKLKQVIYMTKTEIEFSEKFAKFVNQANINELMQIFEEAYYHIERNVNAKLVFTDSSFKIMKVIRKN
ncbi:MAG: DNA polymerase III subunit delta [Bacteroidales bacterium]|nr:DNA polymerase III subunit delta [Bacteroidales bacterium]